MPEIEGVPNVVIGWLFRWVEIWLAENDLTSNDCVKQVAKWIRTGTLADAFATDPKGTMACVVETVARIILAITGDLHKHEDEVLPSPYFSTLPGNESDVLIDASDFEAIADLGDALGVKMPATADGDIESIGPILITILFELLNLYLRNRT